MIQGPQSNIDHLSGIRRILGAFTVWSETTWSILHTVFKQMEVIGPWVELSASCSISCFIHQLHVTAYPLRGPMGPEPILADIWQAAG